MQQAEQMPTQNPGVRDPPSVDSPRHGMGTTKAVSPQKNHRVRTYPAGKVTHTLPRITDLKLRGPVSPNKGKKLQPEHVNLDQPPDKAVCPGVTKTRIPHQTQ